MSDVTYTPTAYWHRLDDECLEPRQTVTITKQPKRPDGRGWPLGKPRKPSPNLDWRGMPFLEPL